MANESIWSVSADTQNAVKGLEAVVTRLQPIQKITTTIAAGGGVAGAVAGDASALNGTQKILGQLNDELERQTALYNGIQKQISATNDVEHWRQLTKEAAQYSEKIAGLQGEIAAAAGKASGADFGMKPSLFRPTQTVSQVVNEFGGQGAGQQLAQTINYVGDFGRSINDLKNDFKDTAPAIAETITGVKAFADTIKTSGGVSAAAAVGFEAITAAISPLALIATAVVGGLILVAAVLNKISGDADKAAEAVNTYTQSLDAQIQAQTEINQLKQSTDPKATTQALTDADTAQAQALQKVQDLTRQIYENDQAYARLGASFNPGDRAKLGAIGQALRTSLADATSAMTDANTKYNELVANTPKIDTAIQGNIAVDNLKKAEDELTQVRIQARDAAKQEQAAIRQFQEQAGYEQQKTLRDRQRQEQVADQQHNRDMVRIVKDGQSQIVSLERDFRRTVANDYKQFAREEVQAAKTLSKALAAGEKDYQKSITKQEAQFRKEQIKSEAQWQKDELRRKQDENQNLFDLELQNDALGYVQSQRKAKIDDQRASDDHTQQEKDAQEAEQQQLDDLRQSRDDQRQALLDSYAEEEQTRKDNLAQQIADERDSLRQREADQTESNAKQLQDAAAAYTDQQALQKQQEDWQDADTREANARQLAQMKSAYDDQITELTSHENNLLWVIKSGGVLQIAEVTWQQLQLTTVYKNATDNLIATVQGQLAGLYGGLGGTTSGGGDSSSIGSTISGVGSTIGSTIGSILGSLTGGGGVTVNARGGVYDRPTLGLLAERGPEMVLPLKQSPGLAGVQGLGGSHYHFDFSGLSVGDGVSTALLQQQLRLMGQTLVRALHDARSGTEGNV